MSLLTIIQAASKRVGLTSPSSAIGLTDANIVRMIELSNEDGKEIARRHPWQALTQESTFATVATESQGSMTTLAGVDFNYIVNGTMWNRTQNRPWLPVDRQRWQQMKSSGITGPSNYVRIRGGNLLVIPVPTASQTVAFEWVSKNWCQTSAAVGQQAWAADTDTTKIDEDILIAGLVWRWKASQGLEYSEDFNKYEVLVSDAIARDGIKGTLNMGAGHGSRMIRNQNVSEGSWTL